MEVPLDEADARGERSLTLGAYYDRLARWTGWARGFGYGGGRDALTVHRTLADPRAGGRPTATRLHDLLLDALPSPPTGAVLDAGCGLGGTMLDLAARSSATFTGLTLSERQAAIGRRAAAQAGFGNRIAIHVASYDSPPDGPFELAIAIESLAHSPNPAASIAAIAARLEPGGCLAIADDVPKPDAAGTRDLDAVQVRLAAPCAARRSGPRGGDRKLRPRGRLGPRPHGRASAAHARGDRTPRSPEPSAAPNRAVGRLRALLDSYRGGLALERLYRHSLMSYRLVVGLPARRKAPPRGDDGQAEQRVSGREHPGRRLIEEDRRQPVLDEARLVRSAARLHAQPTLERRQRARDAEPRLRHDHANRRKMREAKPPAVDEPPAEAVARDDGHEPAR